MRLFGSNTGYKSGIIKTGFGSLMAASLLLSPLIVTPEAPSSSVSAMVSSSRQRQTSAKHKTRATKKNSKTKYRSIARSTRRYKYSKAKVTAHKKKKPAARPAPEPHRPQDYIDNLNVLTLKPGLVHRFYNGPLTINVAEIDMEKNDIAVRPYLAGESFNKLKTVEEHAEESNALVTINANYFKKDGTPLGAIKMDGEWVSGSLFNRVAMGITKDREVKFAPVNLHGILKTSNPEARTIWVNNMNQPRIHGAKLILYTKRWGDSVNIGYEGTVVGVNAHGEVVDIHNQAMRIPYGGYVLTDRKDSDLANLRLGDFVHLTWHTNPKDWNEVDQAISGGPTLVKDDRLYVGLKAERFKLSWTSSKITHRTACGYTKDKKLIFATVEGPHNMWDLAKFMHKLGCVEAMNLDGGGSTTMVVAGKTVTRNASSSQRKVAATLMVLDRDAANRLAKTPDKRYHPTVDLTNFTLGHGLLKQLQPMAGINDARAQQKELKLLTGQKISNQEPNTDLEKSKVNHNDKSNVVYDYSKGDQVIDIDDDLVEVSDKEENQRLKTLHKQLKKQKKEAKKKLEQTQEAKRREAKSHERWSKKLLKPFSFTRKDG